MNRLKDYFLATRPAFLIITLLGCFLGLSIPGSTSSSTWLMGLLGIAVAILAHAGANLLNDYFDHLNGSDECNQDRISPFTGGSRFIQNQRLSAKIIYVFALCLLTTSTALGLLICYLSSWVLLPISIFGVFMAWAYSAKPLQLMSKGILGEIAIAIAWSMLVIGFATLERSRLAYEAIPSGMAFGLMVSNILLVNQVPDIRADTLAGKMTLAAKCGVQNIWIWYVGIFTAAYTLQIVSIATNDIPSRSLVTIAVLPAFIYCAYLLQSHYSDRGRLKSALLLNLIAAHAYTVLFCISII
ncbi:prenyltransferase [Polynucleobacter sp. AM-25C3]|uniref:prenyltransferase n=1 Tax=Polynucleobacter sp. AM-25C3 TaxID=1855569 RepID=UPI001C0CC300|nr:prenyltransferase [Polynucleobacter sp. AM-25C3]MBU3601166.1 prenyltransferase [Polynucleobacter sp. AM-25C3]